MNTRHRGRQGPVLLLLLVGLIVAGLIAAAAVFGRSDGARPVPSNRPAPAPVITPESSGEPADAPGDDPSEPPPVDAMPLNVVLETLTGHNVSVDIVDDTFSVVKAESGTPTASASVEPYTLHVANIDDHTLRLTWVDRPGDNQLALFIDRAAGRFVLVQPEHDTDGDAILHDRVLILTFRDTIDAGSIETFLQEGLDTPG